MILAPAMVSQADKDGDKAVTKGEFAALADAWFDKLDADKAGKLGREQFATRLGDLVPLPGVPPRRAEAAAPKAKRRRSAPPINLGTFVGPGLFTALDADKDGSLTRDEMKNAFDRWAAAWDADKSGSLERGGGPRRAERRPAPPRHRRVRAQPQGRRRRPRGPGGEDEPRGAEAATTASIFLNTTGDLPIPDPAAFYKWIEDGHAFVGMHAAADTLHGDPRYAKMLGGEFANHRAQVEVERPQRRPARIPRTPGSASR